ncbi:MAG: glycyl-radical enzyme activating protein [Ignavibacteriales bacterium]|nr:glycyl-radical enzyme activating protein [Ignavibacteriales bacterium]
MNGLVFDIKRFALHDGPGIRTTVFLKGCSLRCWWCQNPESIREFSESYQVKSISSTFNKECLEDTIFGKQYSVDELIDELVRDRVFYDQSSGGVTFSGGEPLIQHKFVSECLKECKSLGLKTAIDTSGYAPFESFKKIYMDTDIFLYDIKLVNENDHIKFTDVSNELILYNLKHLTELGNKVVIRIPLIPGITDTIKNLDDTVSFLATLKNIRQIDLLPYNKISESKYKRFNTLSKLGELQTQSNEKLQEIKSLFDTLDVKVSLKG